MKKIIVMLALALSSQFVSAQNTTVVNPLVTEFIEAQGMKGQMLEAKESLISYILEDKKDAFSTEFDKMIDKYISKFSKVVSTHLSDSEIKGLIDSIKQEKEFAGLSPEKQEKFDEQLQGLQIEVSMELNDLILEYGDPELLE